MSKPLSAVKQRDLLELKREEAYGLYAAETRKRQQAEANVETLESELRTQALTDGAHGAQKLETARVEYDRALQRSGTALEQVKAYEAQLDDLYRSDFAGFAEAADLETQAVAIALQDLLDSYQRARTAWDKAVLAWSGLCRAHRIAGVPPFPIPDHVMQPLTDGNGIARPPGVEVFGPGDAEIFDSTLHD